MWCKNSRYEVILAVMLSFTLFFCGCAGDKKTETPRQPATVGGAVSTVTATVVEIDYDTRHAVLKMPNGRMQAVAVGPEAYNFDQVKVGDLVDMAYSQSLAIMLEKDSGGQAGVTTSSGMERAPKGQKPEGVVYNTTDVRAKVVGIDYKTRTVDLSGPDGNVFPVVVDDGVPNFENVKVGDIVVARYIEAMAISVRPADTAK